MTVHGRPVEVAHARRKGRLQPRPLLVGEGHGEIIEPVQRRQLALHHVVGQRTAGGDARGAEVREQGPALRLVGDLLGADVAGVHGARRLVTHHLDLARIVAGVRLDVGQPLVHEAERLCGHARRQYQRRLRDEHHVVVGVAVRLEQPLPHDVGVDVGVDLLVVVTAEVDDRHPVEADGVVHAAGAVRNGRSRAIAGRALRNPVVVDVAAADLRVEVHELLGKDLARHQRVPPVLHALVGIRVPPEAPADLPLDRSL